MKKSAYKRILLKLSGEALMGEDKSGIDLNSCEKIATSVRELTELGVQVALVVGGGNFFRGINCDEIERISADHIGMLATLMNGLMLQQAFEKIHCKSRVLSAIGCDVVEKYSWRNALEYLEQKTVLIFVGGTSNPYFTTDSAAALRALEIKADILIKVTKVDGIYSKDPMKYSDAKKFDKLSYSQVLEKKLQVMDGTAIVLCQENRIPIQVIRMLDHSLKSAVFQEPVGTVVTGD